MIIYGIKVYHLGDIVGVKIDDKIFDGEIIAVSNNHNLVAIIPFDDTFGGTLFTDKVAKCWVKNSHCYIDNVRFYGKRYLWCYFSDIHTNFTLNNTEEDHGGLQFL